MTSVNITVAYITVTYCHVTSWMCVNVRLIKTT